MLKCYQGDVDHFNQESPESKWDREADAVCAFLWSALLARSECRGDRCFLKDKEERNETS
jgi:hypothetical protein